MMHKKPIILFSLLSIPVFISFNIIQKLEFNTLPAGYKYSGPFDLDSKLTSHKKGELHFYFDQKTWPVNTPGGYSSWNDPLVDSSFTSYLVNATDSIVNLKHQDGSLIMIQEAQDPTGKWSPIEIWYYSDCGNSYFDSP